MHHDYKGFLQSIPIRTKRILVIQLRSANCNPAWYKKTNFRRKEFAISPTASFIDKLLNTPQGNAALYEAIFSTSPVYNSPTFPHNNNRVQNMKTALNEEVDRRNNK